MNVVLGGEGVAGSHSPKLLEMREGQAQKRGRTEHPCGDHHSTKCQSVSTAFSLENSWRELCNKPGEHWIMKRMYVKTAAEIVNRQKERMKHSEGTLMMCDKNKIYSAANTSVYPVKHECA